MRAVPEKHIISFWPFFIDFCGYILLKTENTSESWNNQNTNFIII